MNGVFCSNLQNVTGRIGETVVTAIKPNESYLNILALESSVIGDIELQLGDLTLQIPRILRAIATRMVRTVVGFSQSNDSHQAGRTRATAIAISAEAVSEILPS
jgi:hypothetical protein